MELLFLQHIPCVCLKEDTLRLLSIPIEELLPMFGSIATRISSS
jgi:hypothetical protein